MKKIYFLMLLLISFCTANVNAQVTIGSQADPHKGAVLDLQSTSKGLKLPNVTLDADLEKFVLDEDATYTPDKAAGMVVFNTTDKQVYFWNGTKWGLVSGHGTTTLEITLSSIALTGTPSKTSYTSGESFDPAGLTITATYSDGSKATIPANECTFTPNPLIAGTTQVTVTHKGKSAVVATAISVAAPTNADGSTTMRIGNNDYKTYNYNGDVWMVENSREGTDVSSRGFNCNNKNVSGTNPGACNESRGWFYTWDQAKKVNNACPSGWHLPSQTEWNNLKGIAGSTTTGSGQWWNVSTSFAGNYNATSYWYSWDVYNGWWSAYSVYDYFQSSGSGLVRSTFVPSYDYLWLSVRCVQD